MAKKINGFTEEYLKRQAKNLKKSLSIKYLEALDKVSEMAGFGSWKKFTTESKLRSKVKSETIVAEKFYKGEKVNIYRKLLVAAINALLELKMISLNGKEWPERDQDGHVFVHILGFPSVVMWNDIGYQELRISVWWKYDHNLHPQANLSGNYKERFSTSMPLAKPQHYRKFIAVAASGWLERKDGKYLQGQGNSGIFDTYVRRGEKQLLESISMPRPMGFNIEGKFRI